MVDKKVSELIERMKPKPPDAKKDLELFKKILEKVIELEGGYKLHKNPGEKAETYAGIYRAAHPDWEGWQYLDRGEEPPRELVEKFYYEHYWKPLERVKVGQTKALMFEFGVNAGLKRAIKIAQKVVGTKVDGILGPRTALGINSYDPEKFTDRYTIERVRWYNYIARRKRLRPFLRGWINRALSAYDFVKQEVGDEYRAL